jgi:hypothetical protein
MEQIRFETKLVTPEEARELLKNNPRNRSMYLKNVTKYAFDMGRGAWRLNTAEPIKIAENGRLIDGQHRLAAIVEAGVPVDMLFAYNVPEDVMDIIDTGMKRTNSDMFQIRGVDSAPLVSSSIRKFLVYSTTKNTNPNSINVPYDIIWNEYEKNTEKWNEIIREIKGLTKNFKFVEPSVLTAWYAICKGISPVDSRIFFDKLVTGIGLTEKDPILVLRNLMITGKYKELNGKLKYAFFIKTWNYFRDKKAISVLRFNLLSDDLPDFR